MRVLYVALTRAINKLVIVGNRNLNTVDKLYGRDDYLNMSTYMDWLIAAISQDKISIDLFDKDLNSDELGDIASLKIINEENEYQDNKNYEIGNLLELSVHDKLYEKFKNIYTIPYEYESDTRDSIKKSVTEITKNFNPEEDGYQVPSYNKLNLVGEYRKPNFVSEKHEYKPTDRGTIIHKIFQGLNYQKYDKKSLNRAFDRLVIENKIKRDELDVVENDKIIKYFNNKEIISLYQSAESIRKEESFLMKYQDYYVNGQIDIMFEFANEIVLLDFKTDTIKREGVYNDQLKIYKQAIEESLGKKVIKSYIYWYNFSELVEVNNNF